VIQTPVLPVPPARFTRALERLFEGASLRSHSRGDYLYLPDDPANAVFLVRSGAVRLARFLDSGRELNLEIAGPGEIVGEAAIFGEAWRLGLAQVLCPSQVARIPATWVLASLDHDTAVARDLAQVLFDRAGRMERRSLQNLSWGCRERLGALLLELSERFGSGTGGGQTLGLRLTHEDLARFIGAARETVTPLLVSLRMEGAISYDRRSLVIRDPRLLRGRAEQTETA
jgi:CRP/FNR family cyclic AMP-dependent transcriptional regulator